MNTLRINWLLSFAILLGGCDGNTLTDGKSPDRTAQSSVPRKNTSAEEKARQEKYEATFSPEELAKYRAKRLVEADEHMHKAYEYWIKAEKPAVTKDEKQRLLLGAEEELNLSVEKNPLRIDALITRGAVYSLLGKMDRVEPDLKLAISMDPKNGSAHFNLACFYSLTNQLDKSAESLSNAIQYG